MCKASDYLSQIEISLNQNVIRATSETFVMRNNYRESEYYFKRPCFYYCIEWSILCRAEFRVLKCIRYFGTDTRFQHIKNILFDTFHFSSIHRTRLKQHHKMSANFYQESYMNIFILNMIYLTVCYYNVMYKFQSESTL